MTNLDKHMIQIERNINNTRVFVTQGFTKFLGDLRH